jgi:hypothetical protein
MVTVETRSAMIVGWRVPHGDDPRRVPVLRLDPMLGVRTFQLLRDDGTVEETTAYAGQGAA